MAFSKNRRLAQIISDTSGNLAVQGLTVPTQSASDNDTSAASTAYVTTAVSGLIDSAPDTLNTLNEIAAALNDDANFNTTVTNAIAAKLPLAGGSLTGALDITAAGTHLKFKRSSFDDFLLGTGTANNQNGLHITNSTDSATMISIHENAPAASLVVNSSGNVGIAETNPQTPLHISSDSASGENVALQIDNNNTTAGNEISMLFRSRVGTTNTDFKIAGIANAANDMDLVFQSDGATERMRIDSSGRLGIGTTSPAEMLHVTGDIRVDTDLILQPEKILYLDGGNDTYINEVAANTIGFNTAGGERVRIDSSGDITMKGGRIILRESDDGNDAAKLTRDADEGYLQLFSSGSQTVELRGNGSSYFNGGNVGIGTSTTTNDAKLIIDSGDGKHPCIKGSDGGANGFTLLADNYTATESQLNLGVSYSSSAAVFARSVKVSDSAADVFLSSQAQYATKPLAFVLDSDGDFKFYNTNTSATTAVDTAVSLSERMRIKSSGNIGIANTSPTSLLHLGDNSNSSTIDIGLQNSSRHYVIKTSGGDLIFKDESAGAERMRIESGGEVGIGTDNPQRLLHIYANSSGDTAVLRIQDNGSHVAGIELLSGHGNWAIHNSDTVGDALEFRDDSEGVTRMIIDSSGNVGIGTTSPAGNLHVVGATGSSGRIYVSDADDGAGGGDSLLVNKSGASAYIYNRDNGSLNLGTNNDSDMVVIDSSGNVGIGETSPAKLGLTGSSVGKVLHMGGDDCQVRLSNSIVHHDNSGNTQLTIRNNYGATSASATMRLEAGSIYFSTGTSFTERLRINHLGRQVYNASATANAHGNFVGEVGSGYKALAFERTVGGGEVGSIVANTGSTSYFTTSDYRLKENVNYTWDATSRLKQLKPARFNYIADDSNTLVDGFLAHEVSSIVPEAILGEKDAVDGDGNPEYQGIDHSKLVPLLVKTIQELEARIAILEG
jgi:hypothetical protein